MKAFGRRAREVMPAAMRALVKTSIWYTHFVIGRFVGENSEMDDDTEVLRDATTAAA
jgi:hypothetical protein